MSIAFRVDRSKEIGSGHFYRCLNLAKVLKSKKEKIRFIFQKNYFSRENKKILLKNKIKFNEINFKNSDLSKKKKLKEDSSQTTKILKKNKIDLLVVDNYKINYSWEKTVKKTVKKLFVIDDLANRKHFCDILVDQNYLHNFEKRYNKYLNKNCKTYLGPLYTILDPKFLKNKIRIRKDKKVKNIFIFFSGTHKPKIVNIFYKILNKKKFKKIKINFIIGNSFKKNNKLNKNKNKNFKIYTSSNNFVSLMKKADLAIGAGGTNTWERLFYGIPSLVTCLSENQRLTCNYLNKKKLIQYLGYHKFLKARLIEKKIVRAIQNINFLRKNSLIGRSIVDGKGSFRISEVISPSLEKNLTLRKAKADDCIDYFNWANDPHVRFNSFKSKKIKFLKHKKWFYEKIKSKNSFLFVLEANKLPIGQIRFDRNKDNMLIDYSLDSIVRGRGWGSKLITLGLNKIRRIKPSLILAKVKSSNHPSISTFLKLGFERNNFGEKIYFYKF
tara:strand:+ start:26574 stop:28067 length:1494 start_codon:yes stop_codon:yes gene_type:complete